MKLTASAVSLLVLAGVALSPLAALSQEAATANGRFAGSNDPDHKALPGGGGGTAPGITENTSPIPRDRSLPAAGADGKTGNTGAPSIVYPPALSHGGNLTK